MGIKALVSAFSSVLLSTQSCYCAHWEYIRHFRDSEIYFDTLGIETFGCVTMTGSIKH